MNSSIVEMHMLLIRAENVLVLNLIYSLWSCIQNHKKT